MKNEILFQSRSTIISLDRDENVVVKSLKTGFLPRERDKLKNEFEVLQQINSPHVVRALSFDDNKSSLRLEFVEGIVLSDFIKNITDINEKIDLAIGIAKAIGEIHKFNIIHKDLNPSNIIIQFNGEKAVIIDFGLSIKLGRDIRISREDLEGTYAFISPEQTGWANRQVDTRSDLYSFGVILYELFTNTLPFKEQNSIELLHAHLAKLPPDPHKINSAIPESLSALIMKLLSKEPEERYQSVTGLIHDLKLAKEGKLDKNSLGQEDVIEQFQLISKLYGREKEIHELKEYYNKISQGIGSVLLVSGEQGIGKTSLINELERITSDRKGYFIKGRFDPYRKNIPYQGVIEAIDGLVQELLLESEEKLHYWRTKIQEAVGQSGQVLIDLVPQLKLVIGSQPPLVKMEAQETKTRFNYVVGQFFNVFAKKEHPLVIWLDDLEYGDEYSINLFQYYISNVANNPALFIFTYQPSSAHIIQSFDFLMKENINFYEIKLGNLDVSAIKNLLSDSFHFKGEELDKLSTLIQEKTLGNPYFINHFIKQIYENGFLAIDSSTRSWRADLLEIQTANMTDNVANLISTKLVTLHEETLNLIKFGALLGESFDIEIVQKAAQIDSHQAEQLLDPAVKDDILFRMSKGDKIHYQFVHSRIQQAAIDLISEDEKKSRNLKLGFSILEIIPQVSFLDNILMIADHFDLGIEKIEEKDKAKIGPIFYSAGLKAKNSAAYSTALKYFNNALSLVVPNERADYILRVNLEVALCERIAGNQQRSEEIYRKLLKSTQSKAQIKEIYTQMIFLAAQQERFDLAIDLIYEAIGYYGYTLPREITFNGIKFEMFKLYLKTFFLTPEKIKKLPQIQDESIEAILSFLSKGTELSFISGKQNIASLMVMRMMDLTIKHGMTEYGATAFMLYGVMLSWIGMHRYKEGVKIARAALDISDRYTQIQAYIESTLIYYSLICRWDIPMQKCAELQKKYYKQQLESGHGPYAAAISMFYILHLMQSGEKLTKVTEEISQLSGEIKRIGSDDYMNMYDTAKNFCLVLKGEAQQIKPGSSESKKGSLTEQYQFFYDVILTWYNYLMGDYQNVIDINKTVAPLRFKFSNHISWNIYYLYYGLSLSAQMIEKKSQKELSEFNRILKNFSRWADATPNYQPAYDLLLGESFRLKGKTNDAIDHYKSAINTSKEFGFIQEEAVANERLGSFYFSLNNKELAKTYLKEAATCYSKWGAVVKVSQLQDKYPDLLAIELEEAFAKSKTGTSLSFDMNSLLEASQALTKEIVLEKHIKAVMRIIALNVGADRALLLINQDNALKIAAEMTADKTEATFYDDLILNEKDNYLARSPLNYSLRTLETVILKDALNEVRYASDPYIRAQRISSLAVVPLVQQSKLVGVIYLENRLSKGLFTPQRLRLLTMLSSQMAFSIENARLYAELEGRVFERTEEINEKNALLKDTLKKLEVTQAKLLEQERLKEREVVKNKLGRYVPNSTLLEQILNQGISTEGQEKQISILFCDIFNFTGISEKMSPKETVEMLNEFFNEMGDIIQQRHGILDKFIGDAFMALFGAVEDDPDHALHAVKAALEIQEGIRRFNKKQLAKSKQVLRAGVGINSGKVLVGNIGSKDRIEFTAIGDSVNTASRVETMTREFDCGILITEETKNHLKDRFILKDRGLVSVKGKANQIRIYEVLSLK